MVGDLRNGCPVAILYSLGIKLPGAYFQASSGMGCGHNTIKHVCNAILPILQVQKQNKGWPNP